VRELLATWEAEANRREKGFSLGLRRLSHFVGDLFPGDLLVVGADTNVGKSTFVSECMFASADAGTKWGYISMEDSERRYTTRWIATLSGVSTTALQRAEDRLVSTVEGRRAFDAYEGRIFAAALQGRTDQQVMAEMSVMARRGAQIIVVDYIGVVTCSTREQDRRNEIRAMLVRMKAHAMRIGVALVIVSQLSRPRDKGEGYEPNKHDLKEAGDLENAAEFVVLLWRPKEHDFAPVNVRLVKSKDGNTGNLWHMQRELFTEDRYGNRRPGSARLREAVRERGAPWTYDFPLLFEKDYEAVLASLRNQ
jgi:replicative DNA helicase